jgi:hypothetical protein
MISQEQTGSGLFQIHSGRFRGLFTAEPATLIPDDYLADMSNLRVTDFGTLMSVPKPEEFSVSLPSPRYPIESISMPWLLYIGMGGLVYLSTDPAVLLANDNGAYGFKFIEFLGRDYTFTRDEGLFDAITHDKIDAPLVGYQEAGYDERLDFQCNAICSYECRLWIAYGSLLRGSGKGKTPDSVDEVNGNRKVFGAWTGPNANIYVRFTDDSQITHLFSMYNGLYIFTPGHVYTLTQFWGGTTNCLYAGQNLPQKVGTGVRQFPLCTGRAIYYVRNNAFYKFETEPVSLSTVLSLPNLLAYYVTEYDNRLWFLVSTAGAPIGVEVNYLYALNKTTKVWEKYDIQLTPKGATYYDTLTAMIAGPQETSPAYDTLYLGTSLGLILRWYSGQAETDTLPWMLVTKAFSPSMDFAHQGVKMKVDYLAQDETSEVIVTSYLDGVEGCRFSFDMEGNLGDFMHRDFDIPTNEVCNTLQFKLEGTGKATLIDIGFSFAGHMIGDVNP